MFRVERVWKRNAASAAVSRGSQRDLKTKDKETKRREKDFGLVRGKSAVGATYR